MTARRRITDPVEAMAQRVAERVVELVLQVGSRPIWVR
jgi:hypothetical protein